MATASPDAPVGALPVTIRTEQDTTLTFERLDDGSVRISGEFESTTVTPAQWASVVARVSWAGSTPERYRKAHRFHHGDEPGEGGGDL